MSYRLFKDCKGNYTLDNTWIRIFVTRLLAVKKTYVFQLRVGKCNTANNKNECKWSYFSLHHNMYFKGANSGQQSALSPCIQSVVTWMFTWLHHSVAHCNETSELEAPENLKWREAFFFIREIYGNRYIFLFTNKLAFFFLHFYLKEE